MTEFKTHTTLTLKQKENILVKCKAERINLYAFIKYILEMFLAGEQDIYDLIKSYKLWKLEKSKASRLDGKRYEYLYTQMKGKKSKIVPELEKFFEKKQIKDYDSIYEAEKSYDFSETLDKQEIEDLYDFLEQTQDVDYEEDDEV